MTVNTATNTSDSVRQCVMCRRATIHSCSEREHFIIIIIIIMRSPEGNAHPTTPS
jgi:hypothetical protein